MNEEKLTLDGDERRIVEETIREHFRVRGWQLHAVNVRTNHVHVVVSAAARDPDEVMNQFKAWCTRKLKEHERSRGTPATDIRMHWWTERGSRRWLNDETSLSAAIDYVVEGQGATLPPE